jgi:Thioredoxin-like/PUB domain
MLAEMYAHLKEVAPSHGLEIVFVSSDRDDASFRNYFQMNMPWLSIPFDQLQFVKHTLNTTYGVRGIPALVILDAVSGQVVVPANQSRQEVSMACRSGEHAVESMLESWLSRVPTSTQELISMLEMSTRVEANLSETRNLNDNKYLTRSIKPDTANVQPLEALIKFQFQKLVDAGHEPNAAAATAIKLIAENPNVMKPGPLDGKATYIGRPRCQDSVGLAKAVAIDRNSSSAVQEVVATALKYLKNARKQPWEPKFRSFKLSNKIADSVTRVEGGWGLLRALGFEVVATHQDFKATIPVCTDLTRMEDSISKVMHEMKVSLK